MISINLERCTGCGLCVDACPASALFLVDGKVALDDSLCQERETCAAAGPVPCVSACANGALRLASQAAPRGRGAAVPALRPVPEVAPVRAAPAAVPVRVRALPAFGAALAWAGRELLPVVADLLLDRLDRYTSRRQALDTGRGGAPGDRAGGGSGRQHRRRRRGRE